MRLFFAVWPDPRLRREVSALIRRFKPTQQARWMEPAKLHLTLAFLGEVPASRLPQLEAVGADMDVACGGLLLDRLELWRRPGVLCLVPTREPAQLLVMTEELARRLRLADFQVERRAFRPHLTLVRRALACPPCDLSQYPPLIWTPKALTLVESTQENGQSCYRLLRSWPLPEGAV